jgi:hypothetical protein
LGEPVLHPDEDKSEYQLIVPISWTTDQDKIKPKLNELCESNDNNDGFPLYWLQYGSCKFKNKNNNNELYDYDRSKIIIITVSAGNYSRKIIVKDISTMDFDNKTQFEIKVSPADLDSISAINAKVSVVDSPEHQ